MARDRKRAKQRRERAGRGAGGASRPRPLPDLDLPESKPIRTEIPGPLEHASGVEDEFEAALVRGADGVPLPAEHEDDLEAEEEEAAEDLLEEPAAAGGRSDGGGRGQTEVLAERPSGAPLRGGNRVIGFLRASWAELQRVQWPDRRQVTQGTAVVIGFVAVAGIYLGVADFVAKEIVEYIL